MTNHTATVEALTAEVRVLMVGSRQVTMSVYAQLDDVDPGQIEPFGRVMPKDAQTGYVHVIGKHAERGDLVRASLPSSEHNIKCHVDARSLAPSCERAALDAEALADQHNRDAERHEEQASALLGNGYIVGGHHGAQYHDEYAAGYDRAAAVAEQNARSATDEITGLAALVESAEARHAAATSRRAAEEGRNRAAGLTRKAREHRSHAEAARAHAEEMRGRLNERLGQDEQETRDITQTAWKWSQLPLIVLAGLR